MYLHKIIKSLKKQPTDQLSVFVYIYLFGNNQPITNHYSIRMDGIMVIIYYGLLFITITADRLNEYSIKFGSEIDYSLEYPGSIFPCDTFLDIPGQSAWHYLVSNTFHKT